MSTIETIFENGVFRPLEPVSFPNNSRVKIWIEDREATEISQRSHTRLRPREYPDDYRDGSETDLDQPSIAPISK